MKSEKILHFILELFVFLIIWALVCPYFIDINKNYFFNIFDNNPELDLLIYGFSIFIGSKIIYYTICKIINTIK